MVKRSTVIVTKAKTRKEHLCTTCQYLCTECNPDEGLLEFGDRGSNVITCDVYIPGKLFSIKDMPDEET